MFLYIPRNHKYTQKALLLKGHLIYIKVKNFEHHVNQNQKLNQDAHQNHNTHDAANVI